MKKTIGLTGTMGSGKSTVLSLLQKSIPVTDCDAVNSELIQKNAPGYLALKNAGLLMTDQNGELDRKKTADEIFADPKKRKQMESILHPMIIERIKNWMNEQDDLCAVEVPLLFEAGLQDLFDEVWTVTCSDSTALERLESGRGIGKEEALRRLSLQFPADKKIEQSDRVLVNDGSIDQLQNQIDRLLAETEGSEE